MDDAAKLTEFIEALTGIDPKVVELAKNAVRYQRLAEAWRDLWAQYAAIIDAFEGFIYICSQNYEVEFMNQHFIEHIGYYPLGQKCYKALHERDDICPWCVNERVFRGETVRWEVQSPKDNHWYYVVNTPVRHPDGTMSKMAMIEDITERKEMEKALRLAEEKYRSIFENAVEGIFQSSPEGRFISLNPAMAGIFGYESPEEMQAGIADIDQQIYVDPQRRLDFKQQMAESGMVQGFECLVHRKDGSQARIAINARSVRDAEGSILYYEGFVQDLSRCRPV